MSSSRPSGRGAAVLDLSDWTKRHRAFDAGVRTLGRIAPERDPGRFAAVLGPLAAAVRLHMEQEETVLLPAAERLPLPPNGTPTVIRRDHGLIRGLLAKLELAPTTAEAVMARADDLVRLGEVLEHHDLRETAGLMPVLDAHVPRDVRAGWIDAFRAAEARLPPMPELAPLPAPPPLSADLSPLGRLRLAAAQDAPLDIDSVPILAHPKGPRLHARLVRRVEAARTDDLLARRDALLDVLRAAELVAHAGAAVLPAHMQREPSR